VQYLRSQFYTLFTRTAFEFADFPADDRPDGIQKSLPEQLDRFCIAHQLFGRKQCAAQPAFSPSTPKILKGSDCFVIDSLTIFLKRLQNRLGATVLFRPAPPFLQPYFFPAA